MQRTMKTFHWLLVISLFPFIASAQPTSRPVKLIGIVSYDGNLAILDVGRTNRRSDQTEQHILGVKQPADGIEIQNIDATKGIVGAEVDGIARTLALDGSDSSTPGEKPPTIRFRGVKLQTLIFLYAEAKNRTVLQHPKLEESRVALTANPQS